MKNESFHHYNDKHTYDSILEHSLQNSSITKSDADLINEYIRDKLDKGKIETRRAARIATGLCVWRRFIKTEYKDMTIKSILAGKAALAKGNSQYGRPYKPGTQRHMIKLIKTFAVYLNKKKVIVIDRDELDDIELPKENYDSIRSDDVLDDEAIDKLIGACPAMQYKAFLAAMYESSARVSEIASLTWRDIEFDASKKLTRIKILDSKTGIERTAFVRVRQSYIKEHRKLCDGANDDDFVFTLGDGSPITYPAIREMLKRASKKTGVKFPKGAGAKLFRASRITNWLKENRPEMGIKKVAWGRSDSSMLPYYEKLARGDIENLMMYTEGDDVPVSKPIEEAKPIVCVCGELCAPGAKFCPECGAPLSKSAATSIREAEEAVEQLPEYGLFKRVMSNPQAIELLKQIDDKMQK